MPVEREERDNVRTLPEFVKITRVGQSVAGRVKKFSENDNGAFVVMEPVYLRDKVGGEWEKYGTAAVGMSTDIVRKVNPQQDAGKFLLFQFIDTEATTRGGTKKLFKVYELSAEEVGALDKKATARTHEQGQPFGFPEAPKPAMTDAPEGLI